MASDVGTGTSISFGTSSFSHELLAVNGNDISRETVQTSHMGTTTAHTFMPVDLYDPGELELTIHFNPNEVPPYSGAAETVTITFPTPSGGAAGATLAGSAICTGYTWGSPLEEKMEATVTLKYSGALTWADSS